MLAAPPGLQSFFHSVCRLILSPAQKALAALHSQPLPGFKMDGAGFKTYRELEQHKKLTTIILLNVAAYIPKDLSTADLQNKKAPKTTNAFTFQYI